MMSSALNRGPLGLATLVLVTCCHANLIPNGGFEANTSFPGNFTGDYADGWSNFSVPSNATPDVWDNSGTDGLAPGYQGYFPHISAFEGSNWIGLLGTSVSPYNEGVSSPSFSLMPGMYTLSLALSYDEHEPFGAWSDPGAVDVYLRKGSSGFQLIGTLAANTVADQWELRYLTITISNADTYSVGLREQPQPGPDSYLGIDDVQLNAVPEPVTALPVIVGLISVLRRKRRIC